MGLDLLAELKNVAWTLKRLRTASTCGVNGPGPSSKVIASRLRPRPAWLQDGRARGDGTRPRAARRPATAARSPWGTIASQRSRGGRQLGSVLSTRQRRLPGLMFSTA